MILLTLLKCIVVGYSNGNESFTGRLFSNYGSLNMLFHIFRYLIYSVLHETFVKEFVKLSFFSSNFKIPFQDIVYYRKLGCLTLWYWKIGKFVRFWGCFFRNKKCWYFGFSWIKYFGNDFSFLIKWHIWVYYCWNYDFELESRLVYILGKTVQGMVLDSYLRQRASSQVTSSWCF